MCLQPLLIRVKSRNPYRGIGLYKTVPCGKCRECINQYVNDYIIRCIYQFRYTIETGGCCAFITLTYSNENLPTYVHPSGKYKGFTFPCFRKSDIKRFRNRIGLALRKYFGWDSDLCKEIKYLICSEYGSHFTKRSHYHGLLYFPKTITEGMLVNILRYAWTKPLKRGGKRTKEMFSGDIVLDSHKFTPLGRFSAGTGGWFVNHESCVKYVCKYVSKDLNGYNDVHNLDDFVNYEDNYEKVRDLLPFHVQSIGLGACMADVITDEDIIKGSVSLPTGEVDDNGQPKEDVFRIPNYVLNKALTYQITISCETSKTNKFTLPFLFHNERYWDIFVKKMEYSANEHAKTLRLCRYGREFPDAFFDTLNISRNEFESFAKLIENNPLRYHYFCLLRNFSTYGLSSKILETLTQYQSCDLANLYYYLVRDKEDARKKMVKKVHIMPSITLKRGVEIYDKVIDLVPSFSPLNNLLLKFKQGDVFELSNEEFELYALYWTEPDVIIPLLNQNHYEHSYDCLYELKDIKKTHNYRKNAVGPYNWLTKQRRDYIQQNENFFVDYFPEYEVMFQLELLNKGTIKTDNLERSYKDFEQTKLEKEKFSYDRYYSHKTSTLYG